MSCTDPIADAITIIRNGNNINKPTVSFPHSSVKENVCKVLVEEGYISRFDVLDTKPARTIKVAMKYGPNGSKVINTIKRISKPGLRIYKGYQELAPVIAGYGINIVSTSKGIFSDRTCRSDKLGGEVLIEVR